MCTMRDNAQSGPNGILLYHYAHKTCSDCGIHLLKSAKNQILIRHSSCSHNDLRTKISNHREYHKIIDME